jgi:hypothetical protein
VLNDLYGAEIYHPDLMYGATFYSLHSVTHNQRWCGDKKIWIPKENRKRENWKMLQTRFDWACSLTEMSSANYRPRPQHRLKQNSAFNHGNGEIFILKHSQMCSYGGYHRMEPSMWHFRAIPWKAAYDLQVKECVCPKWENKLFLYICIKS